MFFYIYTLYFILIFISIVIYTEVVVHHSIFFKIGILKNFANFTEKHLRWSEACNFIKKRL